MKHNVRSAVIGGLAAMLVMALAFAPRLLDPGPSQVVFHDTVADAGPTPTEPSPTTATTTATATTATTAATAP